MEDKYDTQITALRAEISDKEMQWKTDIKKIVEEAGLERPERGERKKRGHHGKKGHHRGGLGMMGITKMHSAGFVLLDPDMVDMEEAWQEAVPTVVEKSAIKIYPNLYKILATQKSFYLRKVIYLKVSSIFPENFSNTKKF